MKNDKWKLFPAEKLPNLYGKVACGCRASKNAWRAAAAVSILALIATACNSDNVGSYQIAQACAPPSNTQVAMIYPAPNSPGIPSNFNEVVIGSSSASGLSRIYYADVVDVSSAVSYAYVNLGAAPDPIPTPNATPLFTLASVQSSKSPGINWPANATLNVYLAESRACTPTLLLGTFAIASPNPSPTPGASASP